MWPNLSPSIRPYLRQNTATIILTVGVGICNSGLMILLPLTIGSYYELLLGSTSNRGQLLQSIGIAASANWTTFWSLFMGLVLLRGLLEYLENRLASALGEGMAKYLRERVFEQQLEARLEVHRQKSVGKYLLRYGSDFQSVRRYLRIGILGFVRDVLFAFMALGLLTYLNAPVTTCLVLSLLPFLGVFGWINNRLEKNIQRRRDQRSANLAFVQSRLVAFDTVKIFNRESVENERFEVKSNALTQRNMDVLQWRNLLNGLLPIALFTMVAAVLASVQWQHTHQQQSMGAGAVITFILAVLSLRPVLRRLLRVGSVWKAGRLSLDKLDMLLTTLPPQDEAAERLLVKQGVIEFQGVRFGYEPNQPVVETLSFRAERGSIFYLNHAAKSTILRLLTKQYEPQAGRILIDKQPISSFSAKAVRKRIAVVSDELPLLGRTVFEAISYSRKPEKRPEAAEMLQQIQTLADLSYPMRLDDRIGENGQLLSKSQRMVLYWVRALLTHKAILLLDEPFEGFSPKGRTQLHQWLQKQVFYKTILVATSELPVTMVQNNARYELSY